jgi:hypothetical protein
LWICVEDKNERENGDTLRLDISYVKEIRIVVVVVGPPRVTEGEEKQKKN